MIDIDYIVKNSTRNNLKKKVFGEVFTPNALINEMLEKLPSEIWYNANLKWLDPAAGVGNFFSIVFNKLMSTLSTELPNKKKREKHILEKMLFFVEIQKESAKVIEDTFNPDGNYKLNLLKNDFYYFDAINFGFFDVVVGNPPYQDNVANDKRKAKNHNLWSFFIEKSYSLLTPKGYLLFITPPAWMSPSSKVLKEIFLRNQLIYVNIEKCNSHFQGIGSKFAYFLLQKINPVYTTQFDYRYNGNVSLQSEIGTSLLMLKPSYKFIPQLPSKLAFSILEKTVFSTKDKLPILYDSDLHRFTKKDLLREVKTKEHIYKVIHTPSQILYSIRPHKNQNKIKVFIPLTTYYEDILIDTCGNTQGMGYIICSNIADAENYKQLLLSKLFIFIANITRWSNFNVPDVMKSLPYFPISNVAVSNENIYAHFNISKKEQEYINCLIKERPKKLIQATFEI